MHLARGSDEEPNILRSIHRGDFEKAKARVLVRDGLQKMIRETQGPVSRTESIFIVIAIAIYHDLDVFMFTVLL